MSRKILAVLATLVGGAVLLAACGPKDQPEPANEATATTMPGAETADENAGLASGTGATPTPETDPATAPTGQTNPDPTDPQDGPESDRREGGDSRNGQ